MKRPFVAKFGLASKKLATMRSGKESSSFWKVDLAAQEALKSVPSATRLFELLTKNKEIARV